MKKVLFVSNRKSQCGVYEFGSSIARVLAQSSRYQFILSECTSLNELNEAIRTYSPDAIIYNYMPLTLPWVAEQVARGVYKSNISGVRVPQIGIIHDITQSAADSAVNYRNRYFTGSSANSVFDYYIAPDPNLLLVNPIVYKTGRLVPRFTNRNPKPTIPTIGSFGFATPNKGFDRVVELAKKEFAEATVRLNIPAADFADRNGESARKIAEDCRAIAKNSGIRLEVSHEYLESASLLEFLAQNSVNVFLYETGLNRGLSSTIDNALAVGRPIAVSDSTMFRHLFALQPPVRVSKRSLSSIMADGDAHLESLRVEWSAENILWDYERILTSVFEREATKIPRPPIASVAREFAKEVKSRVKEALNLPLPAMGWMRDAASVMLDDMSPAVEESYTPVVLPPAATLNRILDNSARDVYRPTIDFLTRLLPTTMAKKIPEASVQQAFVFDTVVRLSGNISSPRMLCVGSHEDTASMCLRKLGYSVEEIDPTVNYTLQEYLSKPTTMGKRFDVVFSTSVIEHDPDDESFMASISKLLSDDGIVVLTCDYQEGWNVGKPKPGCNSRFYTKRDLQHRLLPQLRDCALVDEPRWDCPNPDFQLGFFRYTFATLVARRSQVRETSKA